MGRVELQIHRYIHFQLQIILKFCKLELAVPLQLGIVSYFAHQIGLHTLHISLGFPDCADITGYCCQWKSGSGVGDMFIASIKND